MTYHMRDMKKPAPAGETLGQALLALALCASATALALVDIRVLDHFIVAGSGVLSFAERGLL